MSREGVLWIGCLEPYMTEAFLRNSLNSMGEGESLCGVKLIRNKFTGALVPYGLLQFDSDAAALMAMHKLNGKIIPSTQPPVMFQLTHANAKQSGAQYSDKEHSAWVSELPKDITEKELKRTFATRYESLKTCKLIKEKDGKMYGFLRFGDMNDQREALIHMDGFPGLGETPIRVSMAVPRSCLGSVRQLDKQSTQYSHMYENYESVGAGWGNKGENRGKGGAPVLVSGSSNALASSGSAVDWDLLVLGDSDEETEDDSRLVEYDVPINVDAMNAEFIERSQEVWDAAENDRWIYNLDNDEGITPNFRRNLKRTVARAFDEDVGDPF